MNVETLLPLIITVIGNLAGWFALRRKQTESDIEEQSVDIEMRKVLTKAFEILQARNLVLEEEKSRLQVKLEAAEVMIETLLERIGILEKRERVEARKGDTGPLVLPATPQ